MGANRSGDLWKSCIGAFAHASKIVFNYGYTGEELLSEVYSGPASSLEKTAAVAGSQWGNFSGGDRHSVA